MRPEAPASLEMTDGRTHLRARHPGAGPRRGDRLPGAARRGRDRRTHRPLGPAPWSRDTPLRRRTALGLAGAGSDRAVYRLGVQLPAARIRFARRPSGRVRHQRGHRWYDPSGHDHARAYRSASAEGDRAVVPARSMGPHPWAGVRQDQHRVRRGCQGRRSTTDGADGLRPHSTAYRPHSLRRPRRLPEDRGHARRRRHVHPCLQREHTGMAHGHRRERGPDSALRRRHRPYRGPQLRAQHRTRLPAPGRNPGARLRAIASPPLRSRPRLLADRAPATVPACGREPDVETQRGREGAGSGDSRPPEPPTRSGTPPERPRVSRRTASWSEHGSGRIPRGPRGGGPGGHAIGGEGRSIRFEDLRCDP